MLLLGLFKFLTCALLFNKAVRGQNNVKEVTFSESNGGSVAITTPIVFTCDVQMNSREAKIINVNLMYEKGTVLAAYDVNRELLDIKRDSYTDRLTSVHTGQGKLVRQFRFTVQDAKLTDERAFYCIVYESFSEQKTSNTIQIEIYIPPREPEITLSPATAVHISGHKLIITCKANTGKPAGSIVWFKKYPGIGNSEESIVGVRENSVALPNKTHEVTESYTINVLADTDNGAKYRCAATNPLMKMPEEKPSSETTLDVLFGVSKVTISPSQTPFTRGDVIACNATGNPPATLTWTKMPSSEGASNISSLAGRLTIDQDAQEGSYTYQCSATNVVDGASVTQSSSITFQLAVPTTLAPTTPTVGVPIVGTTTRSIGSGILGNQTGQVSQASLIGGIVGALIGALIIIIIIIFCLCRKKKKSMLDLDNNEKGPKQKSGLDNGPMDAYDVEMDNKHYSNNSYMTNPQVLAEDTVDNTPGSRKGFHMPAEPSFM